MFRFFKKKTDLPDPSAPDQQPDPEAGQLALEPLSGQPALPAEARPEPVFTEARGVDSSSPGSGSPEVPVAARSAAESLPSEPSEPEASAPQPRAGLLSRWFKRNPEQAMGGAEPQESAEQLESALSSQTEPEIELEIGPETDSEIEHETEAETEQNPEDLDDTQKKLSWLAKLRGGLAKTGKSIGGIFVGVRVDEALFEELETALIMADTGVEATQALLVALRTRVKQERIEDAAAVKQALREVLADHLRVLEKPFEVGRVKPLVIMMTGVNGAGKTTSIGKLAFCLQKEGARVLLAAGDTFRAAARQQLVEWGSRNNVDVIAQDGGDPAAVAFDAVNAGRARGMDVVMVDTAGRLPTQLHLMDELKKIRRVIAKADPTAPHEVLLVVDGNQGQNVLSQIRAFDAAVGLTGLIVTKLDGTAKGGTLAAVAAGAQGVRPIPVYWIGVGERIEDLQPFVAAEFAAAVVGQ
jgi:fused signal recognition particle receptor